MRTVKATCVHCQAQHLFEVPPSPRTVLSKCRCGSTVTMVFQAPDQVSNSRERPMIPCELPGCPLEFETDRAMWVHVGQDHS